VSLCLFLKKMYYVEWVEWCGTDLHNFLLFYTRGRVKISRKKSQKRRTTKKKKKKLYQFQLYWNMLPFEIMQKIMKEVKTHEKWFYSDPPFLPHARDLGSVRSMSSYSTYSFNTSMIYKGNVKPPKNSLHDARSCFALDTRVVEKSFIRGLKDSKKVQQKWENYKSRKKFCSKNPRVQNKHKTGMKRY
jgi:hypothetical protein